MHCSEGLGGAGGRMCAVTAPRTIHNRTCGRAAWLWCAPVWVGYAGTCMSLMHAVMKGVDAASQTLASPAGEGGERVHRYARLDA